MEELRKFAQLPWVRCTTCGKVTGHLQARFDEILKAKEEDYYAHAQEVLETLTSQGFDEATAELLADQQARVFADVNFNKKVTEQLGLQRYCCFKTLQNPIVLPLGVGVELDPDVDVGERMSRLQIKEQTKPVLPSAKVVSAQPRVKRVYRAI